MTDLTKAKLIVESEILNEAKKDRGNITNELGNAFQSVECEIQKKFKRLESGEDIYTILPELTKERAERTID